MKKPNQPNNNDNKIMWNNESSFIYISYSELPPSRHIIISNCKFIVVEKRNHKRKKNWFSN